METIIKFNVLLLYMGWLCQNCKHWIVDERFQTCTYCGTSRYRNTVSRGSYSGSNTVYSNIKPRFSTSKKIIKITIVIIILGIIALVIFYGNSNNNFSSIVQSLSNLSKGKLVNQQTPHYNISKFTVCLNELYSPGAPIRFWTINESLAEAYQNDCAVTDYRNTPENASSESYLCHLVYRCENYSTITTTVISVVSAANSTYSNLIPTGSNVLTEAELSSIFGPGNYSSAAVNPNLILSGLAEVNQTIATNLTNGVIINYTNGTGTMQEILINTSEGNALNFYGQLLGQIQRDGANTVVSINNSDGGYFLRFEGGVVPPLLSGSNIFGRKSNYLFLFTCNGNSEFQYRCWHYAIYQILDNLPNGV